jgi:hypothetical protein
MSDDERARVRQLDGLPARYGDCEAWSHHRYGGWRAINIAEKGMTTRLGSKAEFGRIFGTAAAAGAALRGGG